MSNTSYVTSVTVCEDTTQNFELFDLLKQADPAYAATDPAKIKLYVYDGAKWVLSTAGFFTAVDLDTLTLNAAAIPNFNGAKLVRVLGYDSTGNTFTLDVNVTVTPVNDAPSGADEAVSVANGDTYVLGLADFGFSDLIDGHAFKSVVVSAVPAGGTLLLNGVAVTAGQEILASDIEAGKLTFVAPAAVGGDFGFSFQVRDTGGVDVGCGSVDLDPTPNTITFTVPSPGLATLGDKVWLDTNANGVQDAGEAGIAGVTVVLK
ncbi:SdrD B-like domain-containing protein, partial [Zoogloea sp.]|uniref:SdrD B-like domain-containing protein n=1 Tax=Zoogloea sp. TaxID=49181 RepID=UPI0035AE90D0